MPDDVLDRCKADFEIAYGEVMQLHTYRLVWKNLVALLQSRPDMHHNVLVNNWLVTSYTRTLAVGIRRQSEDGGSRGTVASVLRRVQVHAHAFTRESCGLPKIEPGDATRDVWIHRYAADVHDHLDPRRVQSVQHQLRIAQAAARTWVNKKVAHLDPTAPSESVTFGDLEDGMRGLRSGVTFLFPLFNQGSILAAVTPSTPLGWLDMFSAPWYVPNSGFVPVDAFELG
jgi:hypothetical protein